VSLPADLPLSPSLRQYGAATEEFQSGGKKQAKSKKKEINNTGH
jgi:hypothetical protein